jgi:hypothetical protein
MKITGAENGAVVEETSNECKDGFLLRNINVCLENKKRETYVDNDTWHEFLCHLCHSGIREWKKEYRERRETNSRLWSLTIEAKKDTLSEYITIVKTGGTAKPSNDGPLRVFSQFEEMVRRKSYSAKYEQRFGMPMSEYQHEVMEIYYESNNGRGFKIVPTNARVWNMDRVKPTADAKAALRYYTPSRRKGYVCENGILLGADDWFDILHALRYQNLFSDYNKLYKKNERVRKKTAVIATVDLDGDFDDIDLSTRKSEELKNVLEAIFAKAEKIANKERSKEECE